MKSWVNIVAGFFYLGSISAHSSEALLDITGTTLSELMNMKISSLSKRSERFLDAPASVFVITGDEIRRSGVTSIPEALRLAPGVEVARRNANSWKISIRGFNNDIANKLLVLIDGRSSYSPLYAGVFWDVQDTLLEDIARIEVISGPGGTLWGANAVNGVINIITKSSKDTVGGFTEQGAGKEELAIASVRYGGKISENATARAYVKYNKRDNTEINGSEEAYDQTQKGQGGFRIDWDNAVNTYTFQGDVYSGDAQGLFINDFTLGTLPGPSYEDRLEISGANLLGRWEHKFSRFNSMRLQSYLDYTSRDVPGAYKEERHSFDIDFQNNILLGRIHNLVWGVGTRVTRDDIVSTLFSRFEPENETDRTFSTFIQDKITVWEDRFFITLGSKFEHNDYSGNEVQPNARFSWTPDSDQIYWASISKAVRIPSRLDRDLQLNVPLQDPSNASPIYVTVNGNKEFDSEELIAHETGWRSQIHESLSIELALFYNEYDHIQTIEPESPVINTAPIFYVVLPNHIANGMKGYSSGGTLVLQWQPREHWRVRFQSGYLDFNLNSKAGSTDRNRLEIVGDSPRTQHALHSFVDFHNNVSLYTGIRYVADLERHDISDYKALDTSISWTLQRKMTMSLTLQNLNGDHVEYFEGGTNEMERRIYAKVDYRF